MEREHAPPATKRARTLPSSSSSSPAAAGHAEVVGADRLSALGDATLHAILARLPLRDAAATSAVSRRWQRAFATLPRLILRPATFNRRGFEDGGDENRCEGAARWMDALAAVLRGRKAPVDAFEVRAEFMGLYQDYFHGVFLQLCRDGGGGLRELSATNTKYGDCCPLPPSVYACATLTSLDLFNWHLRVPSRLTGLRAVRSLRLRCVVASDADLSRIISRCTVMEHLEIYKVHEARNITIHAPCLRKLEILSYRPLCISVKKAPRLDTVDLNLSYFFPVPDETSWSIYDSKDSDLDFSFSEIEERMDYEQVAEREHELTDDSGNMVNFLRGLGCAKELRLYLPTEYSAVLMPKSLPKKRYLLGLQTLSISLDYNHEGFATLVSCLLNSSPHLKDLRIIEIRLSVRSVPLAAEFWEEQINAECALNHLSSVTFYHDSLFKGHPSGGLCRFLVTNAKVLKRMHIEYCRSEMKPEDAARIEAVRRELHRWPRASPDLLLELSPVDRHKSYYGMG